MGLLHIYNIGNWLQGASLLFRLGEKYYYVYIQTRNHHRVDTTTMGSLDASRSNVLAFFHGASSSQRILSLLYTFFLAGAL